MAISSFKCNLARIRSGLKNLITHHNIVVQTVNTINDDVQKLKANGGGGGGSGGAADPVIQFTFDSEWNIVCDYTPAEVQQMFMENPSTRFMYGVEGEMMELQCAPAVSGDGLYLSLYTHAFMEGQIMHMPIMTVSDNAFIQLN